MDTQSITLEDIRQMNSGTQLFSLERKRALVTGATGHLGSAMALVLAEAGAHVFANSRSASRCQNLVDRLRACGHSAEVAAFDITKQNEIDAFFAAQREHPLHILINNAWTGPGGTIESSSPEVYASSYDITVISVHNIFKAALPCFRIARQLNDDVSVVNICTMYGVVSPDLRIYETAEDSNPPFYGAAKAALLQWTRYAACEYGPEGIRVNSICPGPFPSRRVQGERPDFVQRLSNRVPLRRIGVPEEIRGPVLFLASAAASYVNGANLAVDGGWTCW